MSYAPDFDVDKARGEEAEALYRTLRTAILNGTAEVKRDDGAAKYGNVYVEFECRGRPSGIHTTKATTWVIVCWPVVIAIPVWILKQVARRAYADGHRKQCSVGSHPTSGVVVPVADLLPRAIAVANAPVREAA